MTGVMRRPAARCGRCDAPTESPSTFCVRCGEPLYAPSDTDVPSEAVTAVATPVAGVCTTCDFALGGAWDWCPRCGTACPLERGRGADAATGRAAAWYRDPFGRSAARWWDGQCWSAYASNGDVYWDPVAFDVERTPGVRGVGVAVLAFGFGIGIGLPATIALHEAGEPGGRALLILVSSFILWLALGSALVYLTFARGSGSFVRDYGLRFRLVDLPLGVAGWIAGRILGVVIVLPIVAFWPDMEPTSEGILEDASPTAATWVVLVLVVCIGAPLIEELFFRGLVQTRLVERYGAVAGIGITSVLFGAAHLVGWVGPFTFVIAAALTGGGLVLGVLRHFTGRLGAPILAHVFFNVQALVALAILN